jgi:hypothetical protein
MSAMPIVSHNSLANANMGGDLAFIFLPYSSVKVQNGQNGWKVEKNSSEMNQFEFAVSEVAVSSCLSRVS